MKTTKFLTVIAAIGISIAFCSCKGDDEATGPAGPTGATGNANVQSGVYDISPGSWASDGNGGWYTNITPSSDPTQGGISILFSPDDVNWFGLPYVGYTIGDVDINYVVTTSNIQIRYDPQTGYATIAEPSVEAFAQISLIPPAIIKRYPNTNWNNAMEVSMLPEVQASLHK